MKKLSLIIAMLMGFVLISNTYADDLSDLEELLNSETEVITSGSGEDVSVDVSESVDSTSNSGDVSEKLSLSLTGSIKSDSVTLTFKKLPEYTEYKVYYSKANETELSEKSVSANELEENVTVEVTGLEASTEYQFVVKAFDNDGNPIASTESDSLDVQTTEKVENSSTEETDKKDDTSHPAANDNVIYNPVITTSDNKIHISYKLGSDVKKVQISISDDAKKFTPVVTLGSNVTSYTINAKEPGKKYLKLVPIDAEGELGVCKIGKTDLKDNVVPVEHKEIGKPKTGPEMYLLILIAIVAYAVYAIRKNRA